MNNYTVVLLVPEGSGDGRDGTAVCEIRDCPTPTIAARRARRDYVSGGPYDSDDCEVIAVFEGIHVDVYEPSLDHQEYEDKITEEN